MRNLFITVEDEEEQGTKEMEEDRNTKTSTPVALDQTQFQAEQGKNKKSANPEARQHLETLL